MKKNNSGFSLVELLVVITILAIISVVAYQNFGGATDKAIASRKINDISTIETALMQFKVDNNYYPMPMEYSDNNLWGYDKDKDAQASNTITVKYKKVAIESLTNTGAFSGGGKVMGIDENAYNQIAAKGVIGIGEDFSKKYLSKDLYDPELGDIKILESEDAMIDYGIGRYVYALYAQPKDPATWNITQTSGSYYNLAITLKQSSGEGYESYITGDYDNNVCVKKDSCPETLIGNHDEWIINGVKGLGNSTTESNQQIPYPITDFATNN